MPTLAEEVQAEIERRANEALEESAELLGRMSDADAPRLSGALVASRRIEYHDEPGGGRSAVVSYNRPYAKAQHEAIPWKHPQGGRAKYLSNNLKVVAPVFYEKLKQALKSAGVIR